MDAAGCMYCRYVLRSYLWPSTSGHGVELPRSLHTAFSARGLVGGRVCVPLTIRRVLAPRSFFLPAVHLLQCSWLVLTKGVEFPELAIGQAPSTKPPAAPSTHRFRRRGTNGLEAISRDPSNKFPCPLPCNPLSFEARSCRELARAKKPSPNRESPYSIPPSASSPPMSGLGDESLLSTT